MSKYHDLDRGVPQGSVLGSRLYSTYEYSLCTIINEHNVHYHIVTPMTQRIHTVWQQ